MTEPVDPYRQHPPSDPYGQLDPVPPTTPYPVAYPAAPYGYDAASGLPLSDKSKIIAGLLQIVPGFLFGLGGIGRLYAGNTVLGIAQIAATIIGWISFWCGFLLVLPFFVFGAVWLWFVIDGIVMIAGRPVDGQGRPLRS